MEPVQLSPNVILAIALFTVWEQIEQSERAEIEALIRDYTRRAPDFHQALDHAVDVCAYLRQPGQAKQPRFELPGRDLLFLLGRNKRDPWTIASAFITAWRYADSDLRLTLQTFLQGYCAVHHNFSTVLKRALASDEEHRDNFSGMTSFLR